MTELLAAQLTVVFYRCLDDRSYATGSSTDCCGSSTDVWMTDPTVVGATGSSTDCCGSSTWMFEWT